MMWAWAFSPSYSRTKLKSVSVQAGHRKCHKVVAVDEGMSRIILLSEEVRELQASLGQLTDKLALLWLSQAPGRLVKAGGSWQTLVL